MNPRPAARWHGPTANLRAYGDTRGPAAYPSDNDGLWTGMLLMAQVYRAPRDWDSRNCSWGPRNIYYSYCKSL
jgi:hypothetical protein